MRESVAVAKEADAKKGVSPTKSDNSIPRVRNEPEMQLGSLRDVIGNIRHDGGTPSVDSIATELGGMHTAQRAPALLALQQTHGNRYVQRVIAGIQAKLVVGQPGDIYEQEADRVAEQVMRMPDPLVQRQPEEEDLIQTKPLVDQITPLVQRSVEEKEEEEELLQAKNRVEATPEVTHDLESQINAIRGGGKPLSESERAYFEPRFGADFGQVRLHTGAQAAESARVTNARAFTLGQDVVFGVGQYTPETVQGKKLLAHELAHVVQQTGHGDAWRHREVDPNPLGISIMGTAPMISRYSHQDCTDADLRAHVWPANHIAEGMVNRAIAALSIPLTPHVRDLMMKSFNDASATTVAAVLENFRTMKSEYDGDNYQYECEDDCDSANAYVYGVWTDIHLCMNNLRGRSNHFIGGVMVHEMSHYAAGTDDNEYFYPGSGQTTLSPDDAIDNADSYEGFVGRL